MTRFENLGTQVARNMAHQKVVARPLGGPPTPPPGRPNSQQAHHSGTSMASLSDLFPSSPQAIFHTKNPRLGINTCSSTFVFINKPYTLWSSRAWLLVNGLNAIEIASSCPKFSQYVRFGEGPDYKYLLYTVLLCISVGECFQEKVKKRRYKV